MEYTEKTLACVAKRENNNKRKYLVVNALQGKHIPVSAKKSLDMFSVLAKKVSDAYKNETLLLVGFAETATAIGSALAVELGSFYMQTTREPLQNVEYLFFTESHSHATEQKLCKNDVEKILPCIDRIVFVEDEVTTGNTIMKIINIIEKNYGNMKFAVASLLNGMDSESIQKYNEQNIDVHYVAKTHHENYTAIAEGYSSDGNYFDVDDSIHDVQITEISEDYVNARRLCMGSSYHLACKKLAEKIIADVAQNIQTKNAKIAVIGSEEFMYPAIYTARELEKSGFLVLTHSTTRSPITVSCNPEYPLHSRYELISLYDDDRRTFIYDIQKYDSVVIITDTPKMSQKGLMSLANAFKSQGNNNIFVYRWYND